MGVRGVQGHLGAGGGGGEEGDSGVGCSGHGKEGMAGLAQKPRQGWRHCAPAQLCSLWLIPFWKKEKETFTHIDIHMYLHTIALVHKDTPAGFPR